MPESIQHKLDRVRRPRVQITYDVETLGSIVKTELPFVVGIMADLSGNTLSKNQNLTLLKDRKFVEIDRDNFNTIMEKLAPTATVKGDTLTFTQLEDFDPINVLRQVPDIKLNFESRTRLSNLVAKLDGNIKLQQQFVEEFNKLKGDATTTTALDKYYDSLYPEQKPTAWPPTVTSVVAKKDTLSKPLFITRNEADSDEVQFFKITDISTGGELFKSDNTKIDPAAQPFITVAEGQAGLTFKTSGDTGGSFKVFAALSNADPFGLSADSTTATIFALEQPVITVAPGSKKNDPFTVTIKPNEADTAQVTHFKITAIKGGALTKDDPAFDPTTPFITKEEGQTGLKFKLADGATDGSFKVQAATSDKEAGVVGEPVTVTIPVKPVGGGKK
jgi:type VI secretion system protein ImpB